MRLRFCALLILTTALVTACGQKGPLVLPDAPPKKKVTLPTKTKPADKPAATPSQ